MIILKKCQLLTLLLVNLVAFNACSNSNAENKPTSANNTVLQKVETIPNYVLRSTANLQNQLGDAKKAGKAVFVVVTGSGAIDTDKATKIAKGANTIYKNAIVLQMNRNDKANAKLVSQWRLSGAPLPLILVVSPKGFPTGGNVLSAATPQNIAEIVPSPKLDDVYEALNNSKPVFLMV